MKLKHCKLSKKQQVELIKYFVGEVTARRASELLGLNRNTVNLYYKKLREIITYNLEVQTKVYFSGEIELDESYFGGVRKGKRGRGAAGKVIVFGILKRGGKVFTKVVDNTKTKTLMPIIQEKVMPDSIVYTDTYRSYNALDVSEFTHLRINHSVGFADGSKNHINGIENFWNQAKRVLRKYNGIPKDNFNLFLKECEFRFNYGSARQQLDTLKKWCF
jgi:transposase